MAERQGRWGRGGLAVLALAGLALVGCADDEPSADPSSTTTTTTASLACDGSDPAPVLLEDAPGQATVVDVVARPTGQVVAVGTSVWIRDPDATTWRSVARPGGPDQLVTAAGTHGDEVWIATNDITDMVGASRLFRSSDLETWVEVPFTLDDAPTPSSINAMTHDGDRWLALAQSDDDFALISSLDGAAWTTVGTAASVRAPGSVMALFDLASLAEGPTSVGFTVEQPALNPIEVLWASDGTATDRAPDGDQLDSLRLWALAPLADGRVVVAADHVELSTTNEPLGFTALLFERSGTGRLERLAPLPGPTFAAPADLVDAGGGQLVVVGGVGDARDALSPAAWTVCIP